MMTLGEGGVAMGVRRAGMNIGLAGAAALGLVAGLALGRGKKTVAQAATALHGDWFGVLKAEHRAVQKMLKAMTDRSEERRVGKEDRGRGERGQQEQGE